METLIERQLDFNGMVLMVPESSVTKVLGEPEIDGDTLGYRFTNNKGVEVLILGVDGCFYLYGETKLKDLTTARDLMCLINKAEGRPAYSFFVELDGRLVKHKRP